jgi:hypothetical protein
MTRGTKLALAIAAILLFYAALVLWWNSQRKPYESPPVHTLIEERAVKAALKRHGDITPITTTTRIYFKRDGQEILIARRAS